MIRSMTMKVETGTENKTLRTVSQPVQNITSDLKGFVVDMVKTMDEENGVGLAAPQVGRNIRVIICKFNPGSKNEVVVPMINPVLAEVSKDTNEGEEGCLSLPGTWGFVQRANRILVRFKNLKNQDLALEMNDFNARIVQHEIDHLNGVLFIDKAVDIKVDKKTKKGAHI